MNENELAQAMYGRFAEKDVEGMLEFIHADVEWVNEPKGMHIRGKDALRKAWTNPNPAARVQLDISDVQQLPAGMLVTVQEKVWIDDEMVFDGPVGHKYTLRDGKIARCDIVDV